MFAESTTFSRVLTPRQDRLELALVRGLRTGATRSELREAVYQLVDLYRLQGVSATHGIRAVTDTAARAMRAGIGSAEVAKVSPEECLELVEAWARRRYARGD